MEDTHTSSGSGGGYTDLKRLVLVLCLAGLQSATVLTTDKEKGMSRNAGDNSANDARLEVLVAGPDYATVGVPCTFECEADCPPSNCTYSMAVGNRSAPGQVDTLSFTIPEWVETMTVTCTVKDDGTGRAGAMTKTLQVLAGPANISIRALVLNNTYSCQAYCRPACNYTWWIQFAGQWQGMGQAGNVFTVPHAYLWLGQPAITCKAINSVSGLFISATSSPTLGPSEMTIKGPDYTEMRTMSRFFCVAQCVPPCRYLWHMDNKTVEGNEIEVTVEHPVNIMCEAQNTVSGRSGMVIKTLRLSGHSTALRDQQISALLLCALVFSAVIYL